MMKDIVLYTFLGAALVLIIMNASNFATAITAVGTVWANETTALSGKGYAK
jgi:hypothetical protein